MESYKAKEIPNATILGWLFIFTLVVGGFENSSGIPRNKYRNKWRNYIIISNLKNII